MNHFGYKSIFFALCLAIIVSCKNRSVSPQPQQRQTSDPPKSPKPVNVVIGNSGEGAVDESKSPMNERHEYIDLNAQNNTDGKINNVSVTFGKNRCTFGVLSARASAAYLGWERPVGTNATVKWTDAGGISRQAQVDLSTVYKPEVKGELTFIIYNTNATVGFRNLNLK